MNDERFAAFKREAQAKIEQLSGDARYLFGGFRPRLSSAALLSLHAMEQVGKLGIETWKHRLSLSDRRSLLIRGQGAEHKSKMIAYHSIHYGRLFYPHIMHTRRIPGPADTTAEALDEWASRSDVRSYLMNVSSMHRALDEVADRTTERVRQRLLYVDPDGDDDVPEFTRESVEQALDDVSNAMYFIMLIAADGVYGQAIFFLYRAAARKRGLELFDMPWQEGFV